MVSRSGAFGNGHYLQLSADEMGTIFMLTSKDVMNDCILQLQASADLTRPGTSNNTSITGHVGRIFPFPAQCSLAVLGTTFGASLMKGV